MHALAEASDHDPAAHPRHALLELAPASTENEPATQFEHVRELVAAVMLEYVPALH